MESGIFSLVCRTVVLHEGIDPVPLLTRRVVVIACHEPRCRNRLSTATDKAISVIKDTGEKVENKSGRDNANSRENYLANFLFLGISF